MKLSLWGQSQPAPARMWLFAQIICGFFLLASLVACSPSRAGGAAATAAGNGAAAPSAAAAPTQVELSPTLTDTPSATRTPLPGIQAAVDVSPEPTQTPTQAPSPSPTWIAVQIGQAVEVPILMYHRVGSGEPGERYNVSLEQFEAQIKTLSEDGCTSLTVLELADVLWDGGALPQRPVVITFDDGNMDNYTNALPILSKYGFRGVEYVVADHIGAVDYLGHDELAAMVEAGWEIGSHSMTHANLTDAPLGLNTEMYQSRQVIGQALSIDVLTFAYPYTVADARIFKKARAYGYRAAVCAGPTNQQSLNNIYCLYRREVEGQMSLDDFKRLISWSEK